MGDFGLGILGRRLRSAGTDDLVNRIKDPLDRGNVSDAAMPNTPADDYMSRGGVAMMDDSPSAMRTKRHLNGANEPEDVHGDSGGFTPAPAHLADTPDTVRHLSGANEPEAVHGDSGFMIGDSPASFESGRGLVNVPPLAGALIGRPDPGDLRPESSYQDRPTEPSGVAGDRLNQMSPSRQRYLNEVANLPTEKDYIAANQPQGVKGRIGAAAKSALRTFLQSGLNPIPAVTMLGIGLADKNAPARAQYRTSVEPRSVARQKRLLGQTEGELGMAGQAQNIDLARRRAEQEAIAQQQQQEDRTRTQPWRDRLLQAQVEDTEAQAAERKAQAEARLHPQSKSYKPIPMVKDGKTVWVDQETLEPIPSLQGMSPYEKPTAGANVETDTGTQKDFGRPGETDAEYAQRKQAQYSYWDSMVARKDLDPKEAEDLKLKFEQDNKPREIGEHKTSTRGGRRKDSSGGASTGKQHESLSAARQTYQDYIKRFPENREKARAKFKQQNGVDPEAQ